MRREESIESFMFKFLIFNLDKSPMIEVIDGFQQKI
jgi:hypothetical protein